MHIYIRAILQNWSIPLNLDWQQIIRGNIVGVGVDGTRSMVTYLFLAAAFHAVWLERNSRYHISGHAVPATQLLRDIKSKVREKLSTVAAFQKKAKKDPTLTLLLY